MHDKHTGSFTFHVIGYIHIGSSYFHCVAGLSAGVGALTTMGVEYGVDSGLKGLGVDNKDVRDITKDEIGNLAGGVATVAATTLAGMAWGVPFNAVTFGGASAIGSLIGLGLGGLQFADSDNAEDKTHFVDKAWDGVKGVESDLGDVFSSIV